MYVPPASPKFLQIVIGPRRMSHQLFWLGISENSDMVQTEKVEREI